MSYLRTGSLGVVSQGLSSASNVLMVVLAARTLEPSDFSTYSGAALIVAAAVGLTRAAVVDASVVSARNAAERLRRLSKLLDRRWTAQVAAFLGASLTVAAVDRAVWSALIVATLVCTLVEQFRAAQISMLSFRAPILADSVWLAWSIVLLIASTTYVLDNSSPADILLYWSTGGLFALATLVVLARPKPAPAESDPLPGRERLAMIGDFVVGSGIGYITLGLASIGPASFSLGAVRGVQALAGVLSIAFAGVVAALTPRLIDEDSTNAKRSVVAVVSGVLFLVGALPLIGLRYIGGAIGPQLLGDTWVMARDLLWPFALYYALVGGTSGAVLSVRAAGRPAALARIRVATAAPTLIGGVGGAAWAGSTGFAWGLASSSAVNAAIWWGSALRESSRHRSKTGGGPPTQTTTGMSTNSRRTMDTFQ